MHVERSVERKEVYFGTVTESRQTDLFESANRSARCSHVSLFNHAIFTILDEGISNIRPDTRYRNRMNMEPTTEYDRAIGQEGARQSRNAENLPTIVFHLLLGLGSSGS